MLIKVRYANQQASDAHLAAKPVQNLIHLFTTGDVLAQPPEVHNCPVVHKVLSSVYSVSSYPAIVLLNVPTKSNQSATPVKEWKEMIERVVKDTKVSGALVVAEDKESHSMRIEGMLQDWDAPAELLRVVLENETGSAEVIKVRLVCGFISRGGNSKL
jgi:hypothetical protein